MHVTWETHGNAASKRQVLDELPVERTGVSSATRHFAQAMLDNKGLPCKPSFQVVTGVIVKAVLWAHYAQRHSHWHMIPGHHLRTNWGAGCLCKQCGATNSRLDLLIFLNLIESLIRKGV